MAAHLRVYLLSSLIFTNNILTIAKEHDFDGLDGADHEFKVDVVAGTEQCFYQKTKEGAKLYVSYEVLQGGDRNIDFYVKDPTNRTMYGVNEKSEASMDTDVTYDGIYTICFDNSHRSFFNKLAFVRISIFHKEAWRHYMDSVVDFEELGNRIFVSIDQLDHFMSDIKNHQSDRRMTTVRDSYIIFNNNNYIGHYSLAQCLVIILTSCAQVYILRRFFRNVKVIPSARARI